MPRKNKKRFRDRKRERYKKKRDRRTGNEEKESKF